VLALSVTHAEHARPLWLVVARLKGGKEPWYLLTSDVVRTANDAGLWLWPMLGAGKLNRPGATPKASWAVRAREDGPGSGAKSSC
jgi:hypothetical protein